jgi:hypothetical protein
MTAIMAGVVVAGKPWRQVESLVESGPNDQDFVATSGDDGSVTVRFGDGVHGARPSTDEALVTRRFGAAAGPPATARARTTLRSRSWTCGVPLPTFCRGMPNRSLARATSRRTECASRCGTGWRFRRRSVPMNATAVSVSASTRPLPLVTARRRADKQPWARPRNTSSDEAVRLAFGRRAGAPSPSPERPTGAGIVVDAPSGPPTGSRRTSRPRDGTGRFSARRSGALFHSGQRPTSPRSRPRTRGGRPRAGRRGRAGSGRSRRGAGRRVLP